MQQAKRCAQLLDLPFAYSSNGEGMVEHDFDTGVEQTTSAFPSPDGLWGRCRARKGLTPLAENLLRFPFERTLRNPDGSVKEPR